MINEAVMESYGEQLVHCNKSFDADFEHMIECGHLRWKPWIGAEWKSSERRILVVGESHYAAKPDAEDVQARVEEWNNDSESTREIVCEVGVDEWYASRFFGNLHRALLGADIHGEKRTTLWRNLAFCNFIQRPMRDPGERPSPGEFFGGWRDFMELLKLLRPDTVLFVGVSAANSFDGAMSTLGIEHTMSVDAMQNGAYPRDFSVTFDGLCVRMLAIRHVSQYFAWETWRDYLAQKMPEEIAYLRKTAGVKCESMFEEDPPVTLPGSETSITKPPLKGLPTWLRHKPVIACDYQEINDALGHPDYDDPRFLSVGHSQWNAGEASVKMFRVGDSGRWSRQSEEVPVQRLPWMMAMLLAAIHQTQNPDSVASSLGEQVVAPQELDSLREQLHAWAGPLKAGLEQVKNLLGTIDWDRL